jgi:hypothetical protein
LAIGGGAVKSEAAYIGVPRVGLPQVSADDNNWSFLGFAAFSLGYRPPIAIGGITVSRQVRADVRQASAATPMARP